MSFHTTPISWCQYSPTELLIRRKLKTDFPILKSALTPHCPYIDTFREKDKEYKKAQKQIRPTIQNKISRSTASRFSSVDWVRQWSANTRQYCFLRRNSLIIHCGDAKRRIEKSTLSPDRKIPCNDSISLWSNPKAPKRLRLSCGRGDVVLLD